jgi:hypothetical protein
MRIAARRTAFTHQIQPLKEFFSGSFCRPILWIIGKSNGKIIGKIGHPDPCHEVEFAQGRTAFATLRQVHLQPHPFLIGQAPGGRDRAELAELVVSTHRQCASRRRF